MGMREINKALLMFALLFLYSLTFAADDPITKIKEVYKHTNDLISKTKVREIMLHTGAPDQGPGPSENKKDKWYRVKSAEDVKAFEESDYKAKAYLLGEQVVKIVIFAVSEGWNNTVEYYFYHNGNTAFVFERLNTMQGYNTDKQQPLSPGPYIVERRTYYEPGGKIVRELVKSYFESNKQEVPLKYIRDTVMTYGNYYLTDQSFPFFDLVEEFSNVKP